jgi:hypothetical protein
MAIRAIYESDNNGAIDLRNPGYGFLCAVDAENALEAEDTFQILAETAETDGLDFEVEEAAGDDPALATQGINADVAQRVTATQVVVDATG